MELPTLLAGPILRRCEPARACIWLATSVEASVVAEVRRGPQQELRSQATMLSTHRAAGDDVLGSAEATAVRLGQRLWVHLAEVRPTAGELPADELLVYDVEVGGRTLGDLGLLDGADGLAYAGLGLPSFFLRRSVPALHLLHGSCRLLHGAGEDAFLAADELLAGVARDISARPALLLLTGDQIYGDDVAGPLVGHLRGLADRLMGAADDASVPDLPPLSEVPVYGRGDLMRERAAFTSPKADNHLGSFGEYAAMYLTAWNGRTWPQDLPAIGDALPGASARQRHRYASDGAALGGTRRSLGAVRRVLANTPTLMVFDDHDVTDDWNLTAGWRDRVRARPAGRRIVANALASFWAFQGWGNQPEAFDAGFREQLSTHLVDGGGAEAYERTLWDYDRWSFVAPTDPPTLVLDTRTQRAFDSPEGAARLVGEHERRRLLRLCEDAGHRPGRPLAVVSAVPVYGLEVTERRQKYLAGKLGPYEIDFEAWHSNLHGTVDLLHLLVEDLRPGWCLLLSGDVHFGMTVEARVGVGERTLPIAQLVASSFKHSGAASRVVLDVLGSGVSATHHRVGWDGPPELDDPSGLKGRVLARAANTDGWDPDSPVFLSPQMARRLGVAEPPRYRESRRYVRPDGHRRSVVVGENNVGLVAVEGARVTHRLLGRRVGETRVFTASVVLDPAGAQGATSA